MSEQQDSRIQKERAAKLARKLAFIIYQVQQQEGTFKPSYMSPKFWALVQSEIRKMEDRDKLKPGD